MWENELSKKLKQLAEEFKSIIRFELTRIKLPASYAHLTQDLYVDYRNDHLQVYMYDYWKFIESGRRAGVKKVPIRAIISWLTDPKKKLRPRNSKGKFVKINGVAFAIQQAIYKNGIKPRPFMQNAADKLIEDFSKEIDDLIIKGVLDNLILTELKKKKK